MRTISVRQLARDPAAALAQAGRGGLVIVDARNKPVARLVPVVSSPKPLVRRTVRAAPRRRRRANPGQAELFPE